ncbi:MAG: Actin-like protein 10 [Geoglossum umbratile]|nr:MAG: Actin-like protein 10 [Geoglossum umbratile]
MSHVSSSFKLNKYCEARRPQGKFSPDMTTDKGICKCTIALLTHISVSTRLREDLRVFLEQSLYDPLKEEAEQFLRSISYHTIILLGPMLATFEQVLLEHHKVIGRRHNSKGQPLLAKEHPPAKEHFLLPRKPPLEEEPPLEEKPPIVGGPPLEGEPPIAGGPPVEEELPIVGEPPLEEEPPIAGGPPVEEEPPLTKETPSKKDHRVDELQVGNLLHLAKKRMDDLGSSMTSALLSLNLKPSCFAIAEGDYVPTAGPRQLLIYLLVNQPSFFGEIHNRGLTRVFANIHRYFCLPSAPACLDNTTLDERVADGSPKTFFATYQNTAKGEEIYIGASSEIWDGLPEISKLRRQNRDHRLSGYRDLAKEAFEALQKAEREVVLSALKRRLHDKAKRELLDEAKRKALMEKILEAEGKIPEAKRRIFEAKREFFDEANRKTLEAKSELLDEAKRKFSEAKREHHDEAMCKLEAKHKFLKAKRKLLNQEKRKFLDETKHIALDEVKRKLLNEAKRKVLETKRKFRNEAKGQVLDVVKRKLEEEAVHKLLKAKPRLLDEAKTEVNNEAQGKFADAARKFPDVEKRWFYHKERVGLHNEAKRYKVRRLAVSAMRASLNPYFLGRTTEIGQAFDKSMRPVKCCYFCQGMMGHRVPHLFKKIDIKKYMCYMRWDLPKNNSHGCAEVDASFQCSVNWVGKGGIANY